MKDYYQILRIGRQAEDAEIKKAYRQLAILFHPDKNRSAKASTLFQEINEAHEVLSDPDKRFQYDQLLRGKYVGPATVGQPYHRDPAYRRRQQGYQAPKSGPSEKLLMMLHLLKYLRVTSFVGLAWCAILAVDYLLPSRISKEIVLAEGHREISWQLHHVPNVLVTNKGNQFPVDQDGVGFFSTGDEIEVVSSFMMNILIKVESSGRRYTIDSLASIYSNLLILPIVLLLVSAMGLIVKNGIELRFNIWVGICILLGFNAIFLLFSIL